MGYIVNCKERAISSLDHKWGESAILVLIYLLIGGTVSCGTGLLMPTTSEITSSLTSNIFSLLLIPKSLGATFSFLEVSSGMIVHCEYLTKGYHDFTRIFLTILLKGIYTLLWSLLLIIPGIVKSYSYAMTEFVLVDRPDLAYNEAIEESMRLMQGNKWRLFVLDLSFLGWALLCILTLGIGYLFLAPYMEVAHAHFYADLKADDQEFSDDTITIETI
mgnify:FL=1